jgi:hypothetical protein
VLDAFLGPGHTDFSSDPEALGKNRQNATGCFPTLSNYQSAFDPKVWAGTGTPQMPPGQVQNPGQPQPSGGPISGQTGTQGVQSKFGQTSSYFRLTSVVSIGSAEFNLYSLLYLDTPGPGGAGRGGAGGAVRPIQRSFTPD